jgi:hypothetical protein
MLGDEVEARAAPVWVVVRGALADHPHHGRRRAGESRGAEPAAWPVRQEPEDAAIPALVRAARPRRRPTPGSRPGRPRRPRTASSAGRRIGRRAGTGSPSSGNTESASRKAPVAAPNDGYTGRCRGTSGTSSPPGGRCGHPGRSHQRERLSRTSVSWVVAAVARIDRARLPSSPRLSPMDLTWIWRYHEWIILLVPAVAVDTAAAVPAPAARRAS